MATNESKTITLRATYGELLERSKKFDRSSNFAPKRAEQYKSDRYRASDGDGETGRGSAHESTKARSHEKKGSLAKHERAHRPVSVENFRPEWTAHSSAIERLISQWSGSLELVEVIEHKCGSLEELCQRIVSQNWSLALEEDIITLLWRSAHYPVTEKLRKQIKRIPVGEEKEALSRSLINFLESRSKLYSGLVRTIQHVAKFQLSEMIEGKFEYSSKSHQKKVKLSTFVCHFCYICMGDLCRYREELNDNPDWSKPRSCYLKAQQLVPRDGKPYNQLAVIAIHAHRRLDAVYYYMRSLAAKNPFLSAYDSLMGLFDETSTKAKGLEEKEKAEKEAKRKQRETKLTSKVSSQQRKEDRARGRVEVWILPGNKLEEVSHVNSFDGAAEVGMAVDMDENLGEVDVSELSRRLTHAFLVTQGKLFSKIGIETFSIALDKLLALWEAYLKNDLSLVSDATKIVKMMAISIFSIHNADDKSGDTASCSFYSGLALSVSLHLVSRVLQSAHDHIQELVVTSCIPKREGVFQAQTSASVGTLETLEAGKEDSPSFSHSSPQNGSMSTSLPSLSLQLGSVVHCLAVLLPAMRLWLEWMAAQIGIWSSLTSLPTLVPIFSRFWKSLALFLNSSQELLLLGLPIPVHTTTPCSLLWEDRMLAGFTHLPSLPSTFDETLAIPDVTQLDSQQVQFQCLSRVGLMVHVALSLCEVFSTTTSPVSLHRHDNKQFFVREPMALTSPEPVTVRSNPSSDEEDGEAKARTAITVSPQDENCLDEVVDSAAGGIQKLRLEKERLEEEIRMQNWKEETAQHLIEDVEKKAVTKMIVKPRYLVPDTNCFVDMLKYIRTIVEKSAFVVAVPLIVVAELEGLSKGSTENKRSHTENADQYAQEAVDFIHSQLSSRSTQVKVLTTQGNLLSSLTFRAEVTDKATNDDLILEASVGLHARLDTKVGRSSQGKNDSNSEEHSVVLLTDDRNLRVKAHASHLPVKSMDAFLGLVSLA